MASSHSFKIALLLSGLIHMGAFVALGQEQVTRHILAPPPVVVKQAVQQKKPQSVQFELVDTPASAAVKAPPEKTNLMSNRNTRAQDRFESEKKLKDSPHMEGKSPDARDTRPRVTIPEPPSPPAQPQPKSEKAAPPQQLAKQVREKEPKEKQPVEKPKEASVSIEPKRDASPRPDMNEPEKKEIIQLAKKSADVSPAALPRHSSGDITVASSRNTDADAEIIGELSYAASRHFFGDYLLKMKQAVEQQWVSRLISRYTGIVSSEAVIDFKIQPDGSVTDLAVYSSEGDAYFPVVCVSSIDDAQPFGQIPYSEAYGLPDKFMNKPLNIRFTFRYN